MRLVANLFGEVSESDPLSQKADSASRSDHINFALLRLAVHFVKSQLAESERRTVVSIQPILQRVLVELFRLDHSSPLGNNSSKHLRLLGARFQKAKGPFYS